MRCHNLQPAGSQREMWFEEMITVLGNHVCRALVQNMCAAMKEHHSREKANSSNYLGWISNRHVRDCVQVILDLVTCDLPGIEQGQVGLCRRHSKYSRSKEACAPRGLAIY